MVGIFFAGDCLFKQIKHRYYVGHMYLKETYFIMYNTYKVCILNLRICFTLCSFDDEYLAI